MLGFRAYFYHQVLDEVLPRPRRLVPCICKFPAELVSVSVSVTMH